MKEEENICSQYCSSGNLMQVVCVCTYLVLYYNRLSETLSKIYNMHIVQNKTKQKKHLQISGLNSNSH